MVPTAIERHTKDSIIEITKVLHFLQVIIPTVGLEFKSNGGVAQVVKFFANIVKHGETIDEKRIDIKRDHNRLVEGALSVLEVVSQLGPATKKILGAEGLFPIICGNYF